MSLCLPNIKSELPLRAENKRDKIWLRFFYSPLEFPLGWTLLNQFEAQIQQILSKDLGFSDIFLNVSNFEELYLRAQEIFFDGTGTVVKIYV